MKGLILLIIVAAISSCSKNDMGTSSEYYQTREVHYIFRMNGTPSNLTWYSIS